MIGLPAGGKNIYRVVDQRGNIHVVEADQMHTDSGGVTFRDFHSAAEVASFSYPAGVARADRATYTEALAMAMVPGEACVSSFQAAPRSMVFAACIVAAAFAVSVALKAYELFWFVG